MDTVTELQRKHWNQWNAETRERLLDDVSLRQAVIINRWLETLGRADLEILEVGCGTGWFSEQLTKYGKVTAIDLADEVLERARKRTPRVRFVAGDFLATPFEADGFDVVVTLEVLAHVTTQQRFIAKIAKLLRPGGYLTLATQSRFVIKHFNRVPLDRPGWLRLYVTRRELNTMAGKHLDVLHLFSVTPRANLGIMNLVNSKKINRYVKLIFGDRIERLKERCGLGWTLMLLARKPMR